MRLLLYNCLFILTGGPRIHHHQFSEEWLRNPAWKMETMFNNVVSVDAHLTHENEDGVSSNEELTVALIAQKGIHEQINPDEYEVVVEQTGQGNLSFCVNVQPDDTTTYFLVPSLNKAWTDGAVTLHVRTSERTIWLPVYIFLQSQNF